MSWKAALESYRAFAAASRIASDYVASVESEVVARRQAQETEARAVVLSEEAIAAAPPGTLCLVCGERYHNTMLLPCTHRVACDACADGVSYCSSCSAGVTSFVVRPEQAVALDVSSASSADAATATTATTTTTTAAAATGAASGVGEGAAPRPYADLPADWLCVVCGDAPRNAMLIPCGHAEVCHGCAERSKFCPTCGGAYASSVPQPAEVTAAKIAKYRAEALDAAEGFVTADLAAVAGNRGGSEAEWVQVDDDTPEGPGEMKTSLRLLPPGRTFHIVNLGGDRGFAIRVRWPGRARVCACVCARVCVCRRKEGDGRS